MYSISYKFKANAVHINPGQLVIMSYDVHEMTFQD